MIMVVIPAAEPEQSNYNQNNEEGFLLLRKFVPKFAHGGGLKRLHRFHTHSHYRDASP
jgi:hypothetical protein